MALNNAAADAALDVYVATIAGLPPGADAAMKTALRPLFRAIFDGIRTSAVVKINMPPDGDGHLE